MNEGSQMTVVVSQRARPRSSGFSLIEVIIGIIILVIGLVPLMLCYTMSTKDTKVSISQVRAINHAANLLEALRGFGGNNFIAMQTFPRAMEQRKGGTGEWSPSEESLGGTEATGEDGAPPAAPGGADGGSFAEFKKQFCEGANPILPKPEKEFRRVFWVLNLAQGFTTLIVRVLWQEVDVNSPTGGAERMVELRSVIADPYGAFDDEADAGPDGKPATPGSTNGSGPGAPTGATGTTGGGQSTGSGAGAPAAPSNSEGGSTRRPGLPIPGGGIVGGSGSGTGSGSSGTGSGREPSGSTGTGNGGRR
jgi:type II secretory pathway pseudopilin PulG